MPEVRVLAVTVALAAVAMGQVVRPDGKALKPAEVDAAVHSLAQKAHVTGVGIALFHRGKIEYLKAYGERDTQKRLPLTEDSVMTAASLSKAAFATVVMRLVEQRKLDLDKGIGEYLPKPLPEYPKYVDLAGDERWRKLTLRILLSHRSGFANWRAFEEDRKLRIHFEPGTRYAYSGEGIALAQMVVETATGEPLQKLMEEELFGPVGMTRTSMVWEQRFEEDHANRYDEDGKLLERDHRQRADAAGSMQTTLRDYAAFLSRLMTDKVLRAETKTTMFTPQVAIHSERQFPSLSAATTHAYDAIRLSYGLGWGVYSSPYGPAFFKEGHDDGWRHLALCFSEGGDGILIMTNSSNGEGIFQPVIEALLGETRFPYGWEPYFRYDRR